MDSLTLITSQKYKTIGELLKSPIKSIIQVSNNEKNEDIKSYLYEWLYKNHYSKIKMIGNLTKRIRNISNKPCYYYIMKECFNNIDVLQYNKTIKQILNDECIDFTQFTEASTHVELRDMDNIENEQQLHTTKVASKDYFQFIKTMYSIDSSLTGTFLDYLVRRIICEITQKTFYDRRAECQINNNNEINMILDEEVWTFIPNDDFNLWDVHKKPSIKSDHITSINQGDNFIVKNKKNEWLNIEYRNYNGWIRYRIPNCVDFVNKEFYYNKYIENKYIQRVEPNTSRHICSYGCKRRFVEYTDTEDDVLLSAECKLDECVNICYEKSKNTKLYPSVKIMKELFITSLTHTISFGWCPKQNKVNQILDLIKFTNNIEEVFYLPLKNMCEELVKKKKSSNIRRLPPRVCSGALLEQPNILLNPSLGYRIELLDNKNIPADCDLVINNYLYDIKCTCGKNSVYEMLQLLGYASLLNCSSSFNKVDNISIINLLQGYIVSYDISYIKKDQMVNYLRFLTK
jgi:hypothetical protein